MARRVEGEGPRHATIALVGEAPGAEEDASGRPFIGTAGRLLDWLLQQAGISRDECYITNVVKEQPKGNEFGVFYEDSKRTRPTEALKRWLPNLKVIGLVGNEALYAFTQRRGITNWRGSVIQSGDKWVVPLLHPAYISRVQFMSGGGEAVVVTLSDLRRVKQIAKEGWRPTTRETIVPQTTNEVAIYLNAMRESRLPVSFDIETARHEVRCIGFSNDETQAIVVPISMGAWTAEQRAQVTKTVASFLASDVPKVAHNASYDVTFLKMFYGMEVNNLWLDTMIGWHVLYPEVSKGLDVLTSLYTDIPYYKWMLQKNVSPEQLFTYNGLDCMATCEIARKLEEELKQEKLWGFYQEQLKPLIPLLISMQVRGLRVDHEKREKAKLELEAQAAADQVRLNELAGCPLNVNSPKQVQRFLYETLKLPKRYHRKTGNVTANEQAIRESMSRSGNAALELILSVREKKKIVSTFLGAATSADGRIRCSYNPAGTETGRLSSSASIDGTGGNLQNVPKGVCREVIVPEEGNVFVGMDLRQAEARIVAYLSEDTMLIDAFDKDKSIHLVIGRMIFGKDFSKESTEYRLTKSLVHGYNYGMGINTFAANAGLSVADAKPLFAQMRRVLPSVEQWHRRVEGELGQSRAMWTPLGRRRIFLGGWSDAMLREAIAYVPQSTIGDLTNRIMVRFATLCEGKAWPVLNTHDGIVIECKREDVEEVKVALEAVGRIKLYIRGRECVVPMEIKVGENWDEV